MGSKLVVRKKLAKLRHLIIPKAIAPEYLDSLFPALLNLFKPQTVTYNGGVANIKKWKISCYLEVMDGGIPCTEPNLELLHIFSPLLRECNTLFLHWFQQKSSCNRGSLLGRKNLRCKRLMTF